MPWSSYQFRSSAKDQLGGTAVAIKKIMKPFSTPVLSKRTYRELKLLKHLRHENVSVLLVGMGFRCLGVAAMDVKPG
jgi:serine/threonine protein kinase